jgi:uncharacterized protein YyaL (SSP411 family)
MLRFQGFAFLGVAPLIAVTSAFCQAADDRMTTPSSSRESNEHTNRLVHEKSPYLLQHAHNPVDWYPWGPEAFEKARAENKPIFLSVGYSTCHWCHVMERESFENPAIAALLNEHFVSIKVDREERPDVDRVYMTFVQATTGGGGWPMNVFLTPDLKPFVGGTYFPPEDRGERPGFATVLRSLADAWKNDRDKIVEQGNRILAALQQATASSREGDAEPGRKTIEACYEQLLGSFDATKGGFGGAPKFPRPVTINFLFRAAVHEAHDHAREMALVTLRKMAGGGMHDHLGGGFHRYSVDAEWHVPHFEKMLYDQAQLAVAYLEAFQITRDPFFEKTARDILDYVRRDMTDKAGGFYSAEDADSLFEHGKPGHGEGAFYVWTRKEIEGLLGAEATEIFGRVYGVESQGNAPPGSDPQGEFEGKNILIRRYSDEEAAKIFKKNAAEIQQSLETSRRKLFEARARRPRPHLDDKILTAWNGLMISAFARAAQALDDPAYLQAAQRAAGFIMQRLVASDYVVLRSYREEPSKITGFADDYAFLIQGLLDLYEADFNVQWLRHAVGLQEKQDRVFADKEHGGYFGFSGDDPHILLRVKEDYDGAEPSPNSVAALNLLRLGEITDNEAWRKEGARTIDAFADQMSHVPVAMPQMLVALDFDLATPKQIVIAGKPGADDTRALVREVHRHFLPNKILLLADGGEGQQFLAGKLEFLKSTTMLDGKATAYVCEHYTCQRPTNDAKALAELLGAANPKGR